MVLHHIGDPDRNNFLRSNVLDVHSTFSMTLEQMAEFVEAAVGLRPNRSRPLEAKIRFIAYRGLFRGYLKGVPGLICESALRVRSGYIVGLDAKGRCRVENPIKGLADSQIWENRLPFIMPDIISVSSWDNRQWVEAAEIDDGQECEREIGLADD